MPHQTRKLRAARWSIATATGLALLKLGAGALTGSMAVLSSAVDSLLDILMSGVNFLALRQAAQPADQRHPFGHGKFETVATLVQALFIALSGSWIIYESLLRLAQQRQIGHLQHGIGVLLISSAVSWQISRFLRRTARETESTALQADAVHFSMDVYTNLALVAGLVAMQFFDAFWLDPLLSILIALYILFEALRLVRHGLHDVLDAELPAPLRAQISALIERQREHLVDYHHLRTRRAGSQKIIDFHLTVCKHLSVEEAHAIADGLENEIQQQILGADVTIHIEPCLRRDCPGRQICLPRRSGEDLRRS